jgi:hypothetical protein
LIPQNDRRRCQWASCYSAAFLSVTWGHRRRGGRVRKKCAFAAVGVPEEEDACYAIVAFIVRIRHSPVLLHIHVELLSSTFPHV